MGEVYRARDPRLGREIAIKVLRVGPMPLRKGPHFEAYLKNTQTRRDPAADEKLAQMQKDGLPERDPVACCKAFYEAAARTMVARPDVTGILPPGGDCPLESRVVSASPAPLRP